ncbi:MAG TPA: hypothetical protein PLZ95_17010 [Bryobacteraceae bacterium]|nr:hypothetical protein [Bryobacteraceae bacterium]
MTGSADEMNADVQAQLDRILSSSAFSGSDRHRQFLSFVVNQALKGDTSKLNEFVLGFEVFNRGESFDPRIDSIVRVEARRLRERLKKYYDEEGRNDPIVITIRPRSFVPHFEQRVAPGGSPASPAWLDWLSKRKALVLPLAGVLCLAAVLAVLLPRIMRPPGPPQSASILILPFQTLSPASGQEYLGSALADSIITGLGASSGLRILSRGGQQNPSDGPAADYIVEGSVQVKGSQLLVSVKMTDTRAQSYIWAETREARLEHMDVLGSALTNAIAARIRLPLPPGGGDMVRRRRAASPEAYATFLKGQYYWYQTDRASLDKSLALFTEVTRLDPEYAPAWAWLSLSYQLQAFGPGRNGPSLLARSRQAAAKALQLDDQLAEAHAASASCASLDWNWDRAGNEFRRAVQLNPTWAQGHLMYALWYLIPTGQTKEALGEVFRARELDPLTRVTRIMLAEVLYLNREYEHAIDESEDLYNPATPESPGNRVYFLALSFAGQGKRALAALGSIQDQDGSPAAGVLGYLQAKHGDRRAAQAIQRRLVAQSAKFPPSAMSAAMVSTALGDRDEAFRQLTLAVSARAPGVIQVAVDPVFEPLRSDTRFTSLIQSIGLPVSH